MAAHAAQSILQTNPGYHIIYDNGNMYMHDIDTTPMRETLVIISLTGFWLLSQIARGLQSPVYVVWYMAYY